MSSIVHFFNSNFFIALVTLAVGTVAFSIYKKQQRDAKRDAANVILLEIESAEQQLQLINQKDEKGSLAENIYLMRNSSWDKYRYYFVHDFDRNEWDKVTDFYNKCLQYDAAVAYNNNYFGSNVDKVQSHLQRVLATYAKNFTDQMIQATSAAQKDKLKKKYEEEKTLFRNSYGVVVSDDNYAPPYFYNPQKPVNEAKSILTTIETNLSLTSVGIKLKRMASKTSLWQRIKSGLKGSKVNI